MRLYLRLVFSLTAVVVASDTASASECSEIAKQLALDTTKSSDSIQVNSVNQARFCQAQYSKATQAQKAEIEAAYGLISGGSNNSSSNIDEEQKSICKDNYGFYWYNQISSLDAKRVSEAGASLVKACFDQKSFRVTDVSFNEAALTAVFSYGGPGSIKIGEARVVPNAIATCTATLEGESFSSLKNLTGRKINSGSTSTISCQRMPEIISEPNGIKREHYRGGLITYSTVGGSAEIPLVDYSIPSIGESVAEKLTQRLTAVEQKTANLITALAASNPEKPTEFSQIGVGNTLNTNPNSDLVCPAGQYVVGIRAIKTDGGRYCASCIGGVKIICRPLNLVLNK